VRSRRRRRAKTDANVRQHLPRQRLWRRQVRSHSSPWSHEDHTHMDRLCDEIHWQAELDEARGQQYNPVSRASPLHVL
jgi:hypothetical protein